MSRNFHITPIFLVLLSSVSCAGSEDPRYQSFIQEKQDLSKAFLDQKIREREVRTLERLQQNDAFKLLSATELKARARVGKNTFEDFKKISFSSATEAGLHFRDGDLDAMYQDYKRVWYLADASYNPVSFRKFQPESTLIPFLQQHLSQAIQIFLLEVFRYELSKEGKDSRALGHECSEMIKLRTIVDTLELVLASRSSEKTATH